MWVQVSFGIIRQKCMISNDIYQYVLIANDIIRGDINFELCCFVCRWWINGDRVKLEQEESFAFSQNQINDDDIVLAGLAVVVRWTFIKRCCLIKFKRL